MRKHKILSRLLSWLLIAVMTLSLMPSAAVAAVFTPPEQETVGGSYTAADGAEYAVLYNDYIALYVRKSDGGFVILPATERFDETKELSYAAFQVDGRSYRYGTYYEGVTGLVSISPQVNDSDVLESIWQLGDFVISQIFAITQDTAHNSSYAVKIGCAARYFGEGASDIAGRILLDTQFTPDESIPVVITDGEEEILAVETEAFISPVPAVAMISEAYIEAANAEAEAAVYADWPNKAYLVFDDITFSSPDALMFTDFSAAAGADFSYAPTGNLLFGASGADSAALLHWDAVSVPQGSQAAFGTTYGFYDLECGNPHFDAATVPMSISALSTAAETAPLSIYSNVPKDWFDISANVYLTPVAVTDTPVIYYAGNVANSGVLEITIDYKSGTPQVIKDAVQQCNFIARWVDDAGSGDADVADSEKYGVPVGAPATFDLAAAFADKDPAYPERNELSFTISMQGPYTPAGYTALTVDYHHTDMASEEAVVSMTGGDAVRFDVGSNVSPYGTRPFFTYFVKQDEDFTLSLEMKGHQYRPVDYELGIYVKHGYAWGSDDLALLSGNAGTRRGPMFYDYNLKVPAGVSEGIIRLYIEESNFGEGPYPVNVKAYHASYAPASPTIAAIENALWHAVGGGITQEQGMIWAALDAGVSVDTSVLTSYPGGTLHVYRAGTKTEIGGYSDGSFTMPNEAVDLVYENGTVHRVFTAVYGGGTASVTVNSVNGAAPQVGDQTNIYITDIEEGYALAGVDASGGVTPVQTPGGSWVFDMPASDVTVTVALTAVTPNTNPFYNLYIEPMVGEGMTLYDVAFWTDETDGERLPYQVDSAGLSGRIRKGATVYYAVYPTNWSAGTGGVHDMSQWVVDGFTINGNAVDEFAGINTGSHTGVGYFPYDYTPATAQINAGTFLMPDEDVTLALTGYRKDYTYSLSLEVCDSNGERLTWLEEMIRSAPASGGTPQSVTIDGTTYSSVPGIGQFELNKQTAVFTQHSIYGYTLQQAELLVDMWGVTHRTAPSGQTATGNMDTIIFEPTWPYGGTVRLTYKSDSRTLAVNGFLPDDDGVLRLGEVLVTEGDSFNMPSTGARKIEIAPFDGAYETLLTLTWTETYGTGTHGAYYLLDDGNSTGCTVTFLHGGNGYGGGYAVYKVTLNDENAAVNIQQQLVARNLELSDYFAPNSPNATGFNTVTVGAGQPMNGIWYQKIEDILNASPAPHITRVKLADNGSYSKSVSDTDIFGAHTAAFHFNDDSTLMTLDLRALLGISEGETLPDGSYTLTIDYAYGDGYAIEESKSYTFDLSSTAYRPGEITHVAIAKATNYQGIWRSGVTPGSWVAVPGNSYDDMMENVRQYNTTGYLTYFVCESGFEADDYYSVSPYSDYHQFIAADSTVLVHGHGSFKPMLSTSALMIDEDGSGGITIISNNMSLHSSFLPIYIPVRASSSLTSSALKMQLERNTDYSIPAALPKYETYRNLYPTNEEAVTHWQAAVDAAKSKMTAFEAVYSDPAFDMSNDFLGASLGGSGLSANIGGFEGGITLDLNTFYLMSGGFEGGGRLNLQIPGTTKPIVRLELLSLSTKSDATILPIADVWAEGEGMIQLPPALGGYGGSAYGVFNTYTDTYGFEGEVNFYFIELEGSFYIAKTKYGFPMLDTFILSIGVNDLPIGLGLPPAPAQIIEIEGITMGVTKLADTVSYDITKNTIPSVRIIIGAQFAFVEILGFKGEMWMELLSGGISLSGGLAVGPINFDIIKEMSINLGVRDGPYTSVGVSPGVATYYKGKSSIVFFINSTFRASVFAVDGAGAFGIELKISPKLWEQKGGFTSVADLMEFIDLGISAWGYMGISVLQLSDDWSIYNADIKLDIAIGMGPSLKYMPFGFTRFVFIGEESFFGIKAGQVRLDVLTYYKALEQWLEKKLTDMVNKYEKSGITSLSVAEVSQLQMTLLNNALAAPEQYGLVPDANYEPEYRSFLNHVVASSDARPAPAGRGRSLPGSVISSAIRTELNDSGYTHHVNVPDDGTYILRLSGFGGAALTLEDIQVYKPNGQALTLRSADGGTTAALANAAYNAIVRDGEILLSLADYNNTSGIAGDPVAGVIGTLPGLWQMKSGGFFRCELIQINNPTVASVELSGDNLEITFENTDSGYYYDLALERKGSPEADPDETVTLLKNVPVPAGGVGTLDLTAMPNISDLEDAALRYDVSDILASGSWYARVTLRKGEQVTFSVQVDADTTETKSMLTTEYIADKISLTPYIVTKTPLSASWAANLSAASGGNQSIDVSFDAVGTPPAGTVVTGYSVTVYDNGGELPAMRILSEPDEGGGVVQKPAPMTFSIPADEAAGSYSYNIPNVPAGAYRVGVTPLYAELLPEDTALNGKVYPATQKGAEVRSTPVITIVSATPPVLNLSVTGGNFAELNGATVLFAGPDAELAATGGTAVDISQFDGTLLSATGSLSDLQDYSGQQLVVSARNSAGDSTMQSFTVYGASAPMLLPDNYDDTEQAFIFNAYQDTGKYTITGQTEPGAWVGGVTADENGRFEITGILGAALDKDTLTLSVANGAGMVTMREVVIVRSTQSEPATPPSGSGGSGSQQTIPAADGAVQVHFTQSGGNVTLELQSAKLAEVISKSNRTALFDLTSIADATAAIFPKPALAALAEAGLGLTVRLPQGTVSLDNTALASIAEQAQGSTVSISLRQVSEAALTSQQRNAVKAGDLVFDISILSGTQSITEFDGFLTVTLPYSGRLPVGVWYVSDTGGLEKLNSSYDPVKKTVRFRLTHLSLYVVGYDEQGWSNPFSDVRETDWFYDAVKFVHENGLFAGTSATTFAPETTMTRAMLVTVLWRLAGSPAAERAAFSDVAGGLWYSDAVNWASDKSIVAGIGGGLFDPNGEITREQMVVMLYNYATHIHAALPKIRSGAFADEDKISVWAKEAVAAMYAAEIVNGKGANDFDPLGKAMRAEVATMFQRFAELLAMQ